MAQAVLTDKNKINTVYVKNIDYSRSTIYQKLRSVDIKDVLPFRVKFINIGIPGYGPNTAAPIGIAVIGLNNYIL
jgi:hypothetical protein